MSPPHFLFGETFDASSALVARLRPCYAAHIQDICSGKQKDLKISNFLQVAKACGYRLILEKGEERISLVL